MLKKICFSLAILSVSLTACTALRGGYTVPASHPEALPKGRPVCSSCHNKTSGALVYASFDHTLSFARESHGLQARQQEKVCAMCHQMSYCSDCHAVRAELKPSERRFAEPYRQLPHRGDYRTRHRIDGRIDPASCFNCHGNPRAASTCAPCHGK